jgi:hypothetical protein
VGAEGLDARSTGADRECDRWRGLAQLEFFNLGKYACSTSGNLDGCGCTIAGAYNTRWNAFSTW